MIGNTNSSIRQAFADTMLAYAKTHPNLCVIDADLASSLHLLEFKRKYPRQFYETGVSESNMAGVAAGLARSGKTVVITSYACFSPAINWHVIKQSICYNQANVKIIGSHAGLSCVDLGASHQMLEDIALTSAIPGLQVFAPLDSLEITKMLPVILSDPHPSYLRLVRPDTPQMFPKNLSFTIGKSHILNTGKHLTILGYGPILTQVIKVLSDHPHLRDSLEVINLSSLKPLDERTILLSVKKTGKVIVLEDHQKLGGIGQTIASLLLENQLSPRFIHLAVNNQFGQSGPDYLELYKHYGLGYDAIIKAIKILLKP